MRLALLPLCAIALIAAAPTAWGRSAHGTVSNEVAIEVLASYAECVVASDPKTAAALLQADYSTDAYRWKVRDFARHRGQCILGGGTLRFNNMIFSANLAEALIRRRHVSPERLAEAGQAAFAAQGLGRSLGKCVAEKQPREVLAVFSTGHGSDEERAALAALKDSLPPCMPANMTASLSFASLRAMLALAAYHLVTDGPTPPAGN